MRQLEKLTWTTPARFPTDEAGCLYDPRAREVIRRLGAHAPHPKIEAISAVRLAAKKLHQGMERYADEHGLSEGRIHIVMRLAGQPDHRLPLGDLAEMLDVAPRTITGLIDHLERDGWVRRLPDDVDRRSIQAQLTEKGLERVQMILKDVRERQIGVTRGFSQEELVQLRHLCLRLVQNIDRTDGAEHAS